MYVMPFLRADNPEQEKTLFSWKEIAAFLNRAERTVKRWERERGLPVHRVPGGERGGVFAYSDELADWLKGKSSELEADDAPSDQETDGSTVGGVGSQDLADPRLSETISHSSKTIGKRRMRFAVIGMAAAVAAAGVYATFAHPFSWIRQRLDAIARTWTASSSRQVVVPVSDTERRLAHDLYLKGRFEWNQRTPESLNHALDDFTQAIVHNPTDAHAYAGLADAYEMLYIYGNRQDDDARDRAMAAARKAVELDSSLSEAHRALGYALWRGGNDSEAEKELHLAIQLDPKDPLSHLWLSNILASHNEYVECLAEINRAQELDPASASILAIKGDRLYWMGSRDEGIALLKAAEHSEPRLAIAHWYLAAIAYHRQDYPTYLRESGAAAQLRNDAWLEDVTAKLSAAYNRDGERGLLKAEFAVQESCGPPVYQVFLVNRTRKAIDCLNRNRISEAIQLFEEASANNDKEFEDFREAFTSGSLHLQDIRVVSRLAQDPRFQALMRQKAELQKPAKLPVSPDSGVL